MRTVLELRNWEPERPVFVIPAGKASIGAAYSHFGYSDFKRDVAGLACGLKLSEKIAAGVQIDYFSERTSGEYNNYQ